MLQEKLLHYAWYVNPWTGQELQTLQGKSLEILHPGHLNIHAGPDFNNARLRIDGLEWSGQVEIHVKASDWFRHGHQNDPMYNNVLLHVVYQNDREAVTQQGRTLPALELQDILPKAWVEKHQDLTENLHRLACQPFFPLPSLPGDLWTEQWVLQRLRRKAHIWQERLEVLHHNWEQLLWESILRAQGQGLNGLPFQLLGRALPWKFLTRWRFDQEKLLALLFGQAGLLTAQDAYAQTLAKTHRALVHALPDQPLPSYLWKFGGVRPSAWPSIKLPRLAIMAQEIQPLTELLQKQAPEILAATWSQALPDYWQKHYHFAKPRQTKASGQSNHAWHGTLINGIAPILFLRAELRNQGFAHQQVLDWLAQLPPENNRITRLWKNSGIPMRNALDSQAALERYERACQKKACMDCAIGKHLVFGI